MRTGRREYGSAGNPTGVAVSWLRNNRNFSVHSDEVVEIGADGVTETADYAYGDNDRKSRLLMATRTGATGAATVGVHVDQLGSPGAITNGQGVYDPSGNVDYDSFGDSTAGAGAIDRRYTGQPFDPDLGLQYHRYR